MYTSEKALMNIASEMKLIRKELEKVRAELKAIRETPQTMIAVNPQPWEIKPSWEITTALDKEDET